MFCVLKAESGEFGPFTVEMLNITLMLRSHMGLRSHSVRTSGPASDVTYVLSCPSERQIRILFSLFLFLFYFFDRSGQLQDTEKESSEGP